MLKNKIKMKFQDSNKRSSIFPVFSTNKKGNSIKWNHNVQKTISSYLCDLQLSYKKLAQGLKYLKNRSPINVAANIFSLGRLRRNMPELGKDGNFCEEEHTANILNPRSGKIQFHLLGHDQKTKSCQNQGSFLFSTTAKNLSGNVSNFLASVAFHNKHSVAINNKITSDEFSQPWKFKIVFILKLQNQNKFCSQTDQPKINMYGVLQCKVLENCLISPHDFGVAEDIHSSFATDVPVILQTAESATPSNLLAVESERISVDIDESTNLTSENNRCIVSENLNATQGGIPCFDFQALYFNVDNDNSSPCKSVADTDNDTSSFSTADTDKNNKTLGHELITASFSTSLATVNHCDCLEEDQTLKETLHVEIDDQNNDRMVSDVQRHNDVHQCLQTNRHSEFISGRSLKMVDLPAELRHRQFFKFLHMCLTLTVKVTVPCCHKRKCANQYCCNVTGTGWIFDRAPDVEFNEVYQKMQGNVYVSTSNHLVQNTFETHTCTVTFPQESRIYFKSRQLTVHSVHQVKISGEVKTYLKCVTYDLDFVYKLNMMIEDIKTLSDGLPLAIKQRLTTMAIVMGYPHGDDLALSYGQSAIIRRKLVEEVIDGRQMRQLKNIITCARDKPYDTVRTLLYTAITCPGCIGAPVITFEDTSSTASGQYSLNIWTHYGVLEPSEIGCSSVKVDSGEKSIMHLGSVFTDASERTQQNAERKHEHQSKKANEHSVAGTRLQPAEVTLPQPIEMTQARAEITYPHSSEIIHQQPDEMTQKQPVEIRQQQPAATAHQQVVHSHPTAVNTQLTHIQGTQTYRDEPYKNMLRTEPQLGWNVETSPSLQPPSYPAYITEDKRLESFANWTAINTHSTKRFAENGFFYAGYSDCVRCHQCGLGLKSWKPGDDIVTEHKRFRPNCCFLLRLLSQRHETETREVQSAANEELPVEIQINKQDNSSQHYEAEYVSLNEELSSTMAPLVAGNLPLKLMQSENQKLKDLLNCKVCLQNPVKALFLPCGDLYACETCCNKLSHCPQCHKRILGTVTTYFT